MTSLLSFKVILWLKLTLNIKILYNVYFEYCNINKNSSLGKKPFLVANFNYF